MEQFKFRFQKILEYREYLERLEKQKFAEVLKKYVDKDNELKSKQSRKKKYLKQITKSIENNDFLSLKWMDNSRQTLSFGINRNKSELIQEEYKVNSARAELLEFTKKKKMMEKMKERDYEIWRKEKKKEDNKIMNEIAQQMFHQKKKDENNDTH